MNNEDRGESAFIVGPLLPEEASRHRPRLNDLALELSEASVTLRSAIPHGIRRPLADAVRSMNCYYSNLIEGHSTHPVDIQRALEDDFSSEPDKRDLQFEALAHIRVQEWIDGGGLDAHPMEQASICEIHRRFCEHLPEDLLAIKAPDGDRINIVPGELRDRDVKVGRHVAPSPGSIPRLLAHMHRMYAMQGRLSSIIAIACAHHRLNWVHPFLDLNGRVSRMVSHALLLSKVGSDGLWSVSRGLARREEEYKRRMMAADDPRHGGADGRGNLSESRLAEFAEFFLETCIDQVEFMNILMRPGELRDRVMSWCHREMTGGRLAVGSDRVMREALSGEKIERSALPELLGVKERQARNVSAGLIEAGALRSKSNRAPLELNFAPKLASDWMPGLFPEQN